MLLAGRYVYIPSAELEWLDKTRAWTRLERCVGLGEGRAAVLRFCILLRAEICTRTPSSVHLRTTSLGIKVVHRYIGLEACKCISRKP